jgi:hypothetical protein
MAPLDVMWISESTDVAAAGVWEDAMVSPDERGCIMNDAALFVGWGTPYPGREHFALDGYHRWIEILEGLKEEGEIEDFETVLLGPNGGALRGFTLVFGEAMKLAEITEREEMRRLRTMAGYEFPLFTITPAVVGKKAEEELKFAEEEILPIFDRAPATV